jgi:hypothetical protein
MSVLSTAELDFFAKHGYVVARQVISSGQAERTAAAVWEFTGKNPNDPASWYSDPPRIMVESYHHQTQWDNRTAPRVYEAFRQVWHNDRLWVSHDRASFSPPNPDPKAPENGLHWDMNLDHRPLSFGVQGVLYLTDTPAEQGAFICVPGFHNKIEPWLNQLPKDAKPRDQDLLALGAKRIPAAAGDLVIWRTALPHTASVNRGTAPRIAQYITMSPASDNPEARKHRTDFWRRRLSGLGRYRRERDALERPRAQLTPLGRKLAGVDPW